MHLINPTKRPPPELMTQAMALSAQTNASVYHYQYSGGWDCTDKIIKVPNGALITELKGDPNNPEFWNTGGC